ncbi:MAG: response regulator transcription factor [candidate division KSB1 bacterium]|nr:response regulator transcription factor [candidate division KSB1 bacterium]MDQ7064075.1 response regulator transcription factor [candidate division KSB1 bacterium]
MEKGTVLYFGHEHSNLGPLSSLLERDGFTFKRSEEIDMAQDIALQEKPVAILIDLDSCGENGWMACTDLKDDFITRKAALIMLSSDNDENIRIKALESGADDFSALPFSPREMAARINAIHRRIQMLDNKKIKVKDIEIDLDEHKVVKAGKPLDLTYIQFKLLYLLASRRNNVFSRKEILEKVWGKKVYVTNRTVDVHIKRLREKLGEYKYPSQYIETIHGTGYRFL